MSNEVTQDEHTEKLTQPPLEREVFAEAVWQWGTQCVKFCTKGGVSLGRQISGCQPGLDADVLPDAAAYGLPPPMAETQENLGEDPNVIFSRVRS